MTLKPVVPRALALRDVDEAISYFLAQSAREAALGFVDDLEKTYRQLSRHPALGNLHYAFELDIPGLRFLPIRRYPYLIFYVERQDHLDVWRVLHGHRDVPNSLRTG